MIILVDKINHVKGSLLSNITKPPQLIINPETGNRD